MFTLLPFISISSIDLTIMPAIISRLKHNPNHSVGVIVLASLSVVVAAIISASQSVIIHILLIVSPDVLVTRRGSYVGATVMTLTPSIITTTITTKTRTHTLRNLQ